MHFWIIIYIDYLTYSNINGYYLLIFNKTHNYLTVSFDSRWRDGGILFKKIISALIYYPFIASLFIVDLAILLLHKPPFLFSVAMMTFLIGVSMFFGQKIALFKVSESNDAEEPASKRPAWK